MARSPDLPAPPVPPDRWAAYSVDCLPILRSARQFGVGHLLAVEQPDSRKPAKATEEFAAVVDYLELVGQLRSPC